MRLGQLARKYNINKEEVILFLNEAQAELGPFHHNSKLSADIEDLVIDQFSLSSKAAEEPIEEPREDISADAEEHLDVSEIDQDKMTEADLQLELDPTLPAIKPLAIEKKDDKSIESDRLLALLEADEAANELSNITHIKAPKKELSGLKVVGKIELERPKSKSIDKSENLVEEPKPAGNKRYKGHQRLSEEEKEKRRLKAKEKKEKYEARQEKRRIESEKKKKKALNKARYEEKMQRIKASQARHKISKKESAPETTDLPQTPQPKTILGKFWQWFNT